MGTFKQLDKERYKTLKYKLNELLEVKKEIVSALKGRKYPGVSFMFSYTPKQINIKSQFYKNHLEFKLFQGFNKEIVNFIDSLIARCRSEINEIEREHEDFIEYNSEHPIQIKYGKLKTQK